MRLSVLALPVLLLCSACTGATSHRAAQTSLPSGTTSPGPENVAFFATGSPTPTSGRCPTPRGRDAYAPVIKPTSGSAGTTVTITGNTPLFVKSGRYVGPTGLIGFWWNLPSGEWVHVYFGEGTNQERGAPVIHLGEASVRNRCSYEVGFVVPHVPPGTYPIVPIEHGHGGSAAMRALEFRVTI